MAEGLDYKVARRAEAREAGKRDEYATRNDRYVEGPVGDSLD